MVWSSAWLSERRALQTAQLSGSVFRYKRPALTATKRCERAGSTWRTGVAATGIE